MTRTRKAVVTSAFGYVQFAAAIVLGLVVTPLVLRQVDPRSFGLWLAVGELLGYLALADIGVAAVLPWTIAEARGRQNQSEIRSSLSNGVAVGLIVATVTAAGAAAVWFLAPQLVGIETTDRGSLAGPFGILVVATILSAPLAVFGAVLIGVQDVNWVGSTAVARSVATAAITVGLLADGRGLYALSLGTSLPMVVLAVANVVRLARVEPALVRDWPAPSIAGIRRLVMEGVGGWLGAFGWRLAAMSSSLVLAVTGRAEWIAIYACTSKTTQLLLPASWIVPDSALVGLSHVHGEGRNERRREVVDALLKLYLVLSGGAALGVLTLNPAFVRWWVGDAFYGGVILNALLAIGLVVTSIAHACAAISSALGRRRTIGIAGLFQGGVHLAVSAALALSFGLNGLAAAVIVSAAVTMLPIGLRTLGVAADLSPRGILVDIIAWSWRAAPVLAIGAAVGAANVTLWVAFAALMLLGLVYLWLTRPLYASLPVPPAVKRWISFTPQSTLDIQH
jgi:O-antigen/teichoic acid export membrane protein